MENDPYAYDWSTNKKASTSKKSSTSYFGGGNDAEDEYTYDYSSDKNKKGGSSHFSPQPAKSTAKSNVVVVDSSNALDRAKNMLSKYTNNNKAIVEPVTNFKKTAKTFDEEDLSIDSKEFSDMEISDSDDFNHKTLTKTKSAPLPKKGKKDINELGTHEAIVTVSMGDDESDGYDDTRDFLNKSNLSDSAQKGDFEDDSEHDNYSNEDFDVDDRLAAKGISAMTFDTDLGDSADAAEESNNDFEVEQSNNDFEVEQSNNDFEVEQSNTQNDFEIENDDDNNDVENTSYSRMAYDNEGDEIDESVEEPEDEIEDDMEVSNKPIILSFADLAAIPSWEQTSLANGELDASQAEVDDSADVIEESIVEIVPNKTAKLTTSTKRNESEDEDESYEDDDYNDEFEESRTDVSPPTVPIKIAPVVSAPIKVEAKIAAPAPTVTSKPASSISTSIAPSNVVNVPKTQPVISTVNPVVVEKPYVESVPPSVVPASQPSAPAPIAPAVVPNPAPAAYPLHGYPPPPPPAGAPYYGYPYPVPIQGYYPQDPLQQQQQQQQQYPHAPHMGYPYPYYPPMPAYGMYPPMPYNMPPFDPRMSYGMPPSQNPFSPFPYSQSQPQVNNFLPNNLNSAQPLVLDLLQELRKTKEEAEWAKQKLAETMLFVRDQEASVERLRKSEEILSKVASVAQQPPPMSKSVDSAPVKSVPVPMPVAASRKGRYSELDRSMSESIDEVNESEILDDNDNNDYSDDFEESHLNLSTYSAARATPVKSTVHTKHVTMSSEVAAIAAPKSSPPQPIIKKVIPTMEEKLIPPVWKLERPPATRESVVDPLKASLAHSLLSSQELFRNQIESLKLRLSMANASNSVPERHWEATRKSIPVQYPTTHQSSTFKPAASLADLKKEFAQKRLEDTRRLYEVLTRTYPDLEDEEAVQIAGKF